MVAPWAFLSGTSMSTPHIAGSAAVLLQLHHDWSPAQIKSALVNRADLVIKDATTGMHDVGPTAQGAGRENLSVAADATTWMDPASASFGRVTVGRPTSVTITLYNPTGVDQTFRSRRQSLRRTHSEERSRVYGMLEPSARAIPRSLSRRA